MYGFYRGFRRVVFLRSGCGLLRKHCYMNNKKRHIYILMTALFLIVEILYYYFYNFFYEGNLKWIADFLLPLFFLYTIIFIFFIKKIKYNHLFIVENIINLVKILLFNSIYIQDGFIGVSYERNFDFIIIIYLVITLYFRYTFLESNKKKLISSISVLLILFLIILFNIILFKW